MNLRDRWRRWRGRDRPRREDHESDETPLGLDEDPFAEPVALEIGDVIDLHSVRPREVRAVVEAYLVEAHHRRYRHLRIIHGKGLGVQRELVRKILSRTSFVASFKDAPPEAGGLGATLVELKSDDPVG